MGTDASALAQLHFLPNHYFSWPKHEQSLMDPFCIQGSLVMFFLTVGGTEWVVLASLVGQHL